MKNRDFLKTPKLVNWLQSLKKEGCKVTEVKAHNVIKRRNGDLLFALLHVDVSDDSGKKLMSTALIRGHACVIVPYVNLPDGTHLFVMVRQRRIGNGQNSLEFPAGMMDLSNDPRQVAMEELKEETGIEVPLSSIISLHEGLLYSSAGLCDEGIYFFGVNLDLTRDELQKLADTEHGNEADGEFIKVEIHDSSSLLKNSTSMQTHMGYYLFNDKMEKNSC